MRELEKPENFTLPKARSATKRKVSPKRLEQAVPLPVNVPSKAGAILGLQLIQVSNPEQMALWNELMIREHPRKFETTLLRHISWIKVDWQFAHGGFDLDFNDTDSGGAWLEAVIELLADRIFGYSAE